MASFDGDEADRGESASGVGGAFADDEAGVTAPAMQSWCGCSATSTQTGLRRPGPGPPRCATEPLRWTAASWLQRQSQARARW